MISKKLAGISAAGVGAATAVTALLLGSVSGNATEEFNNSAYGFAATGTLAGDAFAPNPRVEFTGGEPQTATVEDTALQIPPGEGALISLLEVRADAEGSAAKAVGISLGTAGIDILETTCADKLGTVTLFATDGTEMAPEQIKEGLDASPLISVEFDRQTENEDGSLTVDGMVINLLPATADLTASVTETDLGLLKDLAPEGVDVPDQLPAPSGGGQPTLADLLEAANLQLPVDTGSLLEIVITSATCGPVEKEDEAPVPTPVETNLPVTH